MKKSVRRVSKKKIYNNRLMYSLIALGILIVVAVGAYALTPGVAPANGHVITSIAPPSGCGSNTYLEWTGSAWSCSSSISTPPACSGNNKLTYSTSTGWGCTSETDPNVPYKFGGMYSRGSSGTCYWGNPYTGACSCPSGYTANVFLRGSNSNGAIAVYLEACTK